MIYIQPHNWVWWNWFILYPPREVQINQPTESMMEVAIGYALAVAIIVAFGYLMYKIHGGKHA